MPTREGKRPINSAPYFAQDQVGRRCSGKRRNKKKRTGSWTEEVVQGGKKKRGLKRKANRSCQWQPRVKRVGESGTQVKSRK